MQGLTKGRSAVAQRRRSFSPFCSQSGFTLLEILISIAIIAMILTTLYSSFFLSKKAIDSLDNAPVKLQEVRMAADIMRREIESAFYSKEKNYTLFRIEGKDIYGKDTSSLTFTTFSNLVPGPVKVFYFIEKDGSSLKLKKYSIRIIDKLNRKGQDEKAGVAIDLIEDIESFLVEARYRDEWVRIWDSNLSTEIPDEVRFKMAVNINGKRYTFSEVARIRIGRIL